MVEIVWATQSRSGSQFLLQLTIRLLGKDRLWPQSRISGSRKEGFARELSPDFASLHEAGRGLDYFEIHRIKAVKLEDPGNDDFAYRMALAFPESKWLTCLRRIETVIRSHHNIRHWGRSEAYVLRNYYRSLRLFSMLAAEDRLFILNIDEPSAFRTDLFSSFLGVALDPAFEETAARWKPVNDLAYQKRKWGEEEEIRDPPGLDSLRSRNRWLEQVERRYEELWRKCSCIGLPR